ncbi:LVIVD repeat-containing protein [Corallococcus exercitus]|uniref:LVIVD repeat-containing protein n=1 Tax=Corallococcus exercitus TaxID=2316736 RepID=UPI0035D4A4B3
MTHPSRWLLLTASLVLGGCSSSSGDDAGTPPPPVDGGTPDAGPPDAGPPDAGEVWDGGAQTLVDPGDVVEQAPYSDCTFLPEPGTTLASCSDPALFDRSMCPSGALDGLGASGAYEVRHLPSTNPYQLGFTLRLPSDGGVGASDGTPLLFQDVGEGEFFFGTRVLRKLPTPNFRHYTFAGCTRPEPGRVNGCFAQCTPEGRVINKGSFTALRHGWGRGEREASGLRLVSESAVPLAFPVDIYVTKGHAYVVAIGDNTGDGGLAVYDVKDPAHPVLKKRIQLEGDTYWNGAWAKDDALYIASGNSGVIVYDITNPADPQYVRALPGGALNVHTVHVRGDRLYGMAPSSSSQTLMFDVSSALSPQLLERISIPDESFGGVHDAFAYGDTLYVNHTTEGYIAFDVSDPTRVRELGRYAYGDAFSHANAVGTFAGRTIAFEGGEQLNAHLRVLDVTDPANMRLIGQYALRPEYSIHNMVLVGTKLYIAYYQEGVRVLDVSVPPRPREVAYFNTYQDTPPTRTGSEFFSNAIGIRVPGDGFIYVVDTNRGLLILQEE